MTPLKFYVLMSALVLASLAAWILRSEGLL